MDFEFSPFAKIVPDAYHGTDVANVQSIQNNGFRIGTGGTLHLGDGVYFYEGSKAHAKGYLRIRDKTGNPPKVAVFRCEINLGKYIDLHNKEHTDTLRKFAGQIQSLAFDNPAFRKKHNINSKEDVTEGFIINLAASLTDADTVRGTYWSDHPLYAGSKIAGNARLVIAVRNLNKILATHLDYVET